MERKQRKKILRICSGMGVEISPDDYNEALDNPGEETDETHMKMGRVMFNDLQQLGMERFLKKWGASNGSP